MADAYPSERPVRADGNNRGQGPDTCKTPKKLLVIDDQSGLCTVIEWVATTLGLNTRTIQEPLNAIAAFIDFAPDAVMLDMIMPEKDGIDLLNEMLLTGVPAKFILMSGYGDSYMRLARGIAAFHGAEEPSALRKPFRREELVSLLRATLSNDATASDSMRGADC